MQQIGESSERQGIAAQQAGLQRRTCHTKQAQGLFFYLGRQSPRGSSC
jgi:hypothetical protein